MTRVLVAIVANDAARFSEFWSCVLRLRVPEGSYKDVVIGGDWLGARNNLSRRCLDEGFDYLWFMDDDHSFASDLLEKLLASAMEFDLPIVMPLCTTRRPPFHLVTYGRNPDESNPDPYLPISLEGAPAEGIIELEAGGTAGMLIRRDVLEAVEEPWFKNTPRSEDIVFCEDAKAKGFKVYGDLSCRLGHILTTVVAPKLGEEGWVTGLVIGNDLHLDLPTAEQLIMESEEIPEPEAPVLSVVPDSGTPLVFAEAERIEIWVDDEARWWWRAIDHAGVVLVKGSGVSEEVILAAAAADFPGVEVFQIGREQDDSRNIRPYLPPGRALFPDRPLR